MGILGKFGCFEGNFRAEFGEFLTAGGLVIGSNSWIFWLKSERFEDIREQILLVWKVNFRSFWNGFEGQFMDIFGSKLGKFG